MRLISYQSVRGVRAAALGTHGYIDLNDVDAEIPFCVKRLLAAGPAMLERAKKATQTGQPFAKSVDALLPHDAAGQPYRLLPPVPRPEKVICIGVNYADHAAEVGISVPDEPVVFCKFVSALIAHGDKITLPKVTNRVDYEAELVVVIGKRGRDIPKSDAYDHVAGYCCGNDVSARDWQKGKPGRQWLLGKTFDTFAPIGPELVLKDEIPDPMQLGIQLRLNGQVMQDSNTNQCIFDVPALIAYVSQVVTLEVGDLIFTGTPPGVGDMRVPPVYLKPGDTVEVDIERIGVLRNTVVS
ncbi:MAG: fumarylacetoacetate hydrolase family protein [Planctomycetaceae bacterium]|nr:fumarylacetoacetate hydrolase family protein [Planctomycetaceae bacterium]